MYAAKRLSMADISKYILEHTVEKDRTIFLYVISHLQKEGPYRTYENSRWRKALQVQCL